MSKENILEYMLSIAEEINTLRLDILNNKKQLAEFIKLLKQLKMKHQQNIATQVDTNNKPIYSNSDKRAAELLNRLNNDKTCVEYQNSIDNITNNIDTKELSVSYKSYIFRAYQAYSNLK